MARNKRRHSVGFGYIGFGNNHSVFNQKTNKAFSTLKEKLNEETHFHFKLNFSHKKLTKEEREIIKIKLEKMKTKIYSSFSFNTFSAFYRYCNFSRVHHIRS